VASHHPGQMGMLAAQGEMPIASAPLAHCRQRPRVTIFGRDLPHPIHASLRLSPDVGKTQKVERGAARIRMACALRSIDAKVDEVRLVGVERESVPCKPLAQHIHDPLGIFENLERHHAVIGVPHEDTVPLQTRPHVLLEPFIQHMVQVNVCERWRDHSPYA